MATICYILWQFKSPKNFKDMGGAERQLLHIIDVLGEENRFRVNIVSRRSKDDLPFEKYHEKIQIHRIFTTDLPIVATMLFIIFLPLFIIRCHMKERISVIHVQLPDFFLVSLYFVRQVIKVPIIVRIASNELDLRFFHGFWLAARRIVLYFILKMDAIQTLTPTAYKKASKLNFPLDRLYLIPNGVKLSTKSRNYEFLKKRILYVGAMRFYPRRLKLEQKNLEHLIRSFSVISKKIPDLKLSMVGSGNFCSYLMNFVKNNERIIDKVDFYGYKTEVSAYYENSDIFINPSHFEGLPNTVLEAMAKGIYVLCSSIPPHRFLIGDNNQYGDLFNHMSKIDLVQKVLAFYGNPTPYIRKASEAQKLIRRKFAISKIVKEIVEMYRDVFNTTHHN
ncbi:MAG: glycosyltransferase family 4 protein [Candidatus Thorarchaeota archaeon]